MTWNLKRAYEQSVLSKLVSQKAPWTPEYRLLWTNAWVLAWEVTMTVLTAVTLVGGHTHALWVVMNPDHSRNRATLSFRVASTCAPSPNPPTLNTDQLHGAPAMHLQLPRTHTQVWTHTHRLPPSCAHCNRSHDDGTGGGCQWSARYSPAT